MTETIYITEDDTSPAVSATLTDSAGNAIDLTGASVDFVLAEPRGGGNVVDSPATITNASAGEVEYLWSSSDTADSGLFYGTFVVTFGDGSVETFPNTGYYDVIIYESLTDTDQ